MVSRKLKEFLDANQVKYLTISHSPAYTAQEIAETSHVSGKDLAKTVMVKIDGKLAMAVLPASHKVDFNRLKAAAGAKAAELAGEAEFKSLFPDCDVGAMPPFGNLYGMPVFVETSLAAYTEMAFNAGSHSDLIRMPYADFAKLVRPTVVGFSLSA